MLLRAVLMSTTEQGRVIRGRRDGERKGAIERAKVRRKGERGGTRVCACAARVRVYARTQACVCTHDAATSCVRAYVRYRIRQFAIYCLDFNLPSEWPWALPPLPTDIRRRKLPIVSMELDSYCAPTFMPAARARACTHARTQCNNTRVRSFGKQTTPRTLRSSQKRLQSTGTSAISRSYHHAGQQPPWQI